MTVAADFDFAVPAQTARPATSQLLLLTAAVAGLLALAMFVPATRPVLSGLLIAGVVFAAALKLVLRWAPQSTQ